jgi:hypothetical protein
MWKRKYPAGYVLPKIQNLTMSPITSEIANSNKNLLEDIRDKCIMAIENKWKNQYHSNNQGNYNNNEIIANIDKPHSLITGPPHIVKFDKDGLGYNVIQNCAPCVIWIKRNDPIGFAEHHTENANSDELDNKFMANLMQHVLISSIEQEKTKRLTNEAKMEHIREHANMNVSTQYKKTV